MTTAIVVVLLLVVNVTAVAAWLARGGTAAWHTRSVLTRRADGVLRGAAAEAFDQVRHAANRPRVLAGQASEAILDGWYRVLRPPRSTRRRASPSAQPVIECPRAARLAASEGLELGPPSVRCVVARTVAGVFSGVLECSVWLRARPGRPPVRRRLVERRVFYDVRTDITASPEALSTVVIVTPEPLTRRYDNL